MHNFMQKTACLALLLFVAPFIFTTSVHAQQTNAASGAQDEWDQKQMERQDYREEMEKIRIEHEDLENERDQLKVQCLNAKGQDRSTCQSKWQDLHQRKAALHERTQALHAKMQAERAHHGTLKHHYASGNAAPQSQSAPQTPVSTSPQ